MWYKNRAGRSKGAPRALQGASGLRAPARRFKGAPGCWWLTGADKALLGR